jgi:hypothetical protein
MSSQRESDKPLLVVVEGVETKCKDHDTEKKQHFDNNHSSNDKILDILAVASSIVSAPILSVSPTMNRPNVDASLSPDSSGVNKEFVVVDRHNNKKKRSITSKTGTNSLLAWLQNGSTLRHKKRSKIERSNESSENSHLQDATLDDESDCDEEEEGETQ